MQAIPGFGLDQGARIDSLMRIGECRPRGYSMTIYAKEGTRLHYNRR